MHDEPIDLLIARVIDRMLAARPRLGRRIGDRRYDGLLPPINRAAIEARSEELRALDAELSARLPALDPTTAHGIELGVALQEVRRERFYLKDMRIASADPNWALDTVGDVSHYLGWPVMDPSRLGALRQHLEQIPDALRSGLGMLDSELRVEASRRAERAASGYGTFLRETVLPAVRRVAPAAERTVLERNIETAASACEWYGEQITVRARLPGAGIGEQRLVGLLAAQEGMSETVSSLRSSSETELRRLVSDAEELAALRGRSFADLVGDIEIDHPAAHELLETAEATLDRLRRFWESSPLLRLPDAAPIRVSATPPYQQWASALYEPPSLLAADLSAVHRVDITIPTNSWSEEERDGWLRFLNRPALEILLVHEVYPGHYVHTLVGRRPGRTMRAICWSPGLAEGWAHYAEQLAIEAGLGRRRPELRVAQVREALLRACRFVASIRCHADGDPPERIAELFRREAHCPDIVAAREVRRVAMDPMCLLYTYGKLQILRWRDEASPSDPRDFHDLVLGMGAVPLGLAGSALKTPQHHPGVPDPR